MLSWYNKRKLNEKHMEKHVFCEFCQGTGLKDGLTLCEQCDGTPFKEEEPKNKRKDDKPEPKKDDNKKK
jgi:DnaJ-class molecular chaperone